MPDALLSSPRRRGKVRDLYDLGDRLLLVASDRLSAFDVVLPDPIPYKGEVLTKLSLFWFELLGDVVPNHLLSADVADLPERVRAARRLPARPLHAREEGAGLPGRVHRARLPRRQRLGRVPARRAPCAACSCRRGCVESTRLPQPIFTPSTKAEIGDARREHLLRADGRDRRRRARRASCGRSRSPSTRRRATTRRRAASSSPTRSSSSALIDGERHARRRGAHARLELAFWPADDYEPGRGQPSFDKQFVRDWLEASGLGQEAAGAGAARRRDRGDVARSTSRPTSSSPAARSSRKGRCVAWRAAAR